MKAKKEPGPFARKFIEHCDKEAAEIAKHLNNELDSVEKDKRERFLAFCLSDELVHFFYRTLKFQLSDPDGASRFRGVLAARAGRVSGAKRWNSSVKLNFLRWAMAENARNPGLSKNSIAERFAKENPGVSVSTLRRYLAAIPTEED